MELYINNKWTECYGTSYIAEAIAWSENGNHATIYATGATAEEADAKLMGALRELKLIPEPSVADDCDRYESPIPRNRIPTGLLAHSIRQVTSRWCPFLRGSRNLA
jgi:hypothetical protein